MGTASCTNVGVQQARSLKPARIEGEIVLLNDQQQTLFRKDGPFAGMSIGATILPVNRSNTVAAHHVGSDRLARCDSDATSSARHIVWELGRVLCIVGSTASKYLAQVHKLTFVLAVDS